MGSVVVQLTGQWTSCAQIQGITKALGLSGKIITTPFSYVATTTTIIGKTARPCSWIFGKSNVLLLTHGIKSEAAITDNIGHLGHARLRHPAADAVGDRKFTFVII
jgi:hypothetical protein